ncbi:hypothetical protein K5D32_11755 [Pseudomonas cichorii]|uniref:hypothetical protein n=1 Tax=Pseudomonas cichorii TaxID=36746 RepID=UPI001C899B3F|nr:hypothetical protein [Pseudomonas cichorii]MBX8530344.1 hypothetical protein [Pseudomonas cichorii]
MTDDRLDALAIGVQFFPEYLEQDSEVGTSEMLEGFLMDQMEEPSASFDDHNHMFMIDVMLSF